MNSEVGQWLLSRTPFGCLVRTVLILFAFLIVPIWGFDQYLRWRATQPGQPARPAGPNLPAIHLDHGRPLLAGAAIAVGVLAMVAARRLAPARYQRRLYPAVQGAGALLALSQPGLLVGAAITFAVCWERPWPFRYLVRGCVMLPAWFLLALGAWCWGWPLLLVRSPHLPIAQAVFAALVEVLLGAVWLRLYVDLTSTAEAEMRMVKRSKQLQERFDHAAGPAPIHPPFWQRRRRHPAGSIDLGVDRVRGRGLRIPLRCLRRHATLVGVTGSGRRWPSPASSRACSHSQSRGR